MKILILPLVLILIPISILVILLYFIRKHYVISKSLKIVLGIFFVALGLWATGYATILSLEGIGEKGIRCATGVVFFPILGLAVNLAGILLLLIFYTNTSQKIQG